MEALDKLFFFIFFLASTYVLRSGYYLIQSWVTHVRYTMEPKSLFYLGVSIAYILACVFTGIKL